MALNLTSRQARRAFVVGAAASIFALAACQTGPRGPLEPTPSEPPSTGLAYNGVAVIVPLTGPDGPVGTSISNATLKADVTVRALENMEASGASSISLADAIEAGKLSVTLSGASRLDGRIKTSDGRLEASGTSRARLSLGRRSA